MITMATRKIVFVDDEPSVLQGIRRMLRPFRNEWQMEFFENGKDALAALDAEKYDVIVTDMRMPGMDGAELLAKVQASHPDVVRVVLSGAADKDTVMKSVEPTHQYLTKPCDPNLLKTTVTRACALRDMLTNDALTTVVTRIESLPSLPSVYAEITKLLRDPEAAIQDVGELIGKDVAMTAKILKMVNSTFFGIPRRVETPAQAASVLGIQVVKTLVLSVGVFSQFEKLGLGNFSIEDFERHSQQVGQLAKEICRSEKADNDFIANALLAGFMHDIGKLVLVQNLNSEYELVLNRVTSGGVDLVAAEREMLGASHAEIGGYLLGLWGLNDEIVEAITFHHTPQESKAPMFSPLSAVHVANAIVHERQPVSVHTATIDLDYLESLQLADRLDGWRDLCQHAFDRD